MIYIFGIVVHPDPIWVGFADQGQRSKVRVVGDTLLKRSVRPRVITFLFTCTLSSKSLLIHFRVRLRYDHVVMNLIDNHVFLHISGRRQVAYGYFDVLC